MEIRGKKGPTFGGKGMLGNDYTSLNNWLRKEANQFVGHDKSQLSIMLFMHLVPCQYSKQSY